MIFELFDTHPHPFVGSSFRRNWCKRANDCLGWELVFWERPAKSASSGIVGAMGPWRFVQKENPNAQYWWGLFVCEVHDKVWTTIKFASKPNFYYLFTWQDTHAQTRLIASYFLFLLLTREREDNARFYFIFKGPTIKFEIIILW